MSTIAFIPVRGGSKSIPQKNIKPLCGEPLVLWSFEALEACSQIDEIVVATDSDVIAETVSLGNYRKTKVYCHFAQNATDTALLRKKISHEKKVLERITEK